MNKITYPDDEQLLDIANRWNSNKSGYSGTFNLAENHRFIGLCGEREFARLCGIPMDLEYRPRGSARVNAVIPPAFPWDSETRVDVNTRRRLRNGTLPDLIVSYTDKGIDIDVMALMLYDDQSEPAINAPGRVLMRFLGWTTVEEFGKYASPKGQLVADGPQDFMMSRSKLFHPALFFERYFAFHPLAEQSQWPQVF